MSRNHLTHDDRIRLASLKRAGLKQCDIARQLGKNPSTICRELKRNPSSNLSGYNVRMAQENTDRRRLSANQHFRKIENNVWLQKHIKKKLKLDWSPEQIAGRLKREKRKAIICHESIYQYVYDEGSKLTKLLRYKKSKYRRRYGTKKREIERELARKRRVNDRPEIINNRKRVGDWEGDTIHGKDNSGAIATHVERKAGYLLGGKLEQNNGISFKESAIKSFEKVPQKKRLSCTYDNGPETSEFELIERQLKMTIFFANPYHSWERGTNENTNGLLRQYFPKGSRFDTVTQQDIDRVVRLLNHRPRKRLKYLTPYEVFIKNCVSD
ncbi:MAG TPA: IS30 family transposase [Patescibacteria group bacterium]|nr:IS30 family transposase [Patescibacteria group bacterium]